MCLLDERSLFLGLFGAHALLDEFPDFGLIVFVEGNVKVTNQVVTLLACGLGCVAVAPLEPCEHRLADVDATVVDDVGLHNLVAVGLHNLGQAETQQVVAHVSQVQGLVGVGRRILNHHQLAVVGSSGKAIVGRLGDMLEHAGPERGLDGDVQEALDNVELLDGVAVGQHMLANLLSRHVGRLVRRLQEGKYHNRLVALKFLLGRLGNNLLGGEIHAIQLLDRNCGSLSQNMINRHHLFNSLFIVF